MDRPPKRKRNRAQRRAQQQGSAPAEANANEDGWIVYDDGETPQDGPAAPEPLPVSELAQTVPRPPGAGVCPTWHFYWCDGHGDWHHFDQSAVDAIAASMPTAPEA